MHQLNYEELRAFRTRCFALVSLILHCLSVTCAYHLKRELSAPNRGPVIISCIFFISIVPVCSEAISFYNQSIITAGLLKFVEIRQSLLEANWLFAVLAQTLSQI